jgi:hypothetical protein
MSFDPSLPDDRDERPRRREQRVSRRDDYDRNPVRGRVVDEDGGRRGTTPHDSARSYTLPPAIGMILCAVCNLPLVIICVMVLYAHLTISLDEFVAQQRMAQPAMKNMGLDNAQAIQNPKGYLRQIQITYAVMTLCFGLSTLFILIGGIQMLRLRGYVLSVVGAATLAVPCVTLCIGVGQIVGVWALIVLFTTSVREEFR